MNSDFDGDVIDSPGTAIREAASAGMPVQKVGNQFATAIAVQRPRVLAQVERRVLDEARMLGERAFFHWTVKDKRTGQQKLVEGPTIKLANVLLRNWGNCATQMFELQELNGAWVFSAAFIDLETGTTMTRQFRQTIPRETYGKYDKERFDDMRFQIAQSKAIRNAITNGVPQWLIDKAIVEAKKDVLNRLDRAIQDKGIERVRETLVTNICKFGVTAQQVAARMDRATVAGLTREDMIILNGDYAGLMDGSETVESLGYMDEEKTIQRGTEGLKTVLGTDSPAKPAEEPPKRKPGRPRTVQAPPEQAPEDAPTDDRESLLKRVRSAYISLAAQKREAVASQYENALALSELGEWSTDDLRDLERKILEA